MSSKSLSEFTSMLGYHTHTKLCTCWLPFPTKLSTPQWSLPMTLRPLVDTPHCPMSFGGYSHCPTLASSHSPLPYALQWSLPSTLLPTSSHFHYPVPLVVTPLHSTLWWSLPTSSCPCDPRILGIWNDGFQQSAVPGTELFHLASGHLSRFPSPRCLCPHTSSLCQSFAVDLTKHLWIQ